MKTIELSAAMNSAAVVENLKNFAGVDQSGALGLITPERLAAIAGEFNFFCPTGGVYEDVDLGLPSGTKWAKCNVGATKESEYGDLFAWGCTSPYRLSGNTSLDNTSNYPKCFASKIQTSLLGVTDAATINWGKGWKMPTSTQFQELIANCTSEWTQIDGVNGRKFISKNNNNYIFLPAAGTVSGSTLSERGTNGIYWSSSIYSNANAWRMFFHSSTQYVNAICSRNGGLSVRAVRV